MNNMEYKELLNILLDKASEKLEDAEAFLVRNKEIQLSIFENEVNKYNIAESGGLSLRGRVDGKMGYSYTEKIDDSSVDMLIEETLENGKYIEDKDPEIIYEGSKAYKDINNYNEKLGNVPITERIDFLKKLEKKALDLDDRVFTVDNCACEEIEQERYIMNTKGIELHDKFNGMIVFIFVVVKEGQDTKTGMSYRMTKDFYSLDYEEMAKEAVEDAISMLGADTIDSNNYPIVFENKTFSDLLAAFSSTLSAENVQKGLSGLKDKIGEQIANPILNIVDNPFLEGGFGSRNFDDEGTSTSYKKIIDNGKLTTYIYNWKTANKDGVKSTGHASRGYKSRVSIAPNNLYVEKGETKLKDLLESTEGGLYIDELQGLHSGLNAVSGDFSLSASGYKIEGGEISTPVNQITIAGNLYELLKDIEAIGDDLEFGMPMNGYIGSPSIKVKSLSVAGK